MNRLKIDATGMTVICVGEPKAQVDKETGAIRTNMDDVPMWDVEVTLIEDNRAETVRLGVGEPGLPKGLTVGSFVRLTAPRAFVWQKAGRAGVIFSADALTIVQAPAAAAPPKAA